MTLIPYTQLAVRQRLAWWTGILTTYNGLESRICYRQVPRESWEFLVAVDLERDRRDLRLALFTDPAPEWSLPLEHEGVPAQNEVTAASVTVDSTYADWVAVGTTVRVVGADPEDEDDSFVAAITVLGGTTGARVLTLDTSPPVGGSYPAGRTRVYPVTDVLLRDEQSSSRSPVNGSAIAASARDVGAGQWQLSAVSAEAGGPFGTGSAALATHDGYYVLDLRPTAESEVEEQFITAAKWFDKGGVVTQEATRTYAAIQRAHLYQTTGAADRQRVKKFLTTVYGPQIAFLLPTWRPDLDLVAQPIAPYTSLVVYQTPGYLAWFSSLAHKHLQLVKDDGTVVYAKATAVVDNMDGTETITLSAAVGAGPFTEVGLLELARLADDVVELDHIGDRMTFPLRALVVQR